MRVTETQKLLLDWAIGLGGSIILAGPDKDTRVNRCTLGVANRLHHFGLLYVCGGASEMRGIVTFAGFRRQKLRGKRGRPFAEPLVT